MRTRKAPGRRWSLVAVHTSFATKATRLLHCTGRLHFDSSGVRILLTAGCDGGLGDDLVSLLLLTLSLFLFTHCLGVSNTNGSGMLLGVRGHYGCVEYRNYVPGPPGPGKSENSCRRMGVLFVCALLACLRFSNRMTRKPTSVNLISFCRSSQASPP